MRRLVDRSHVLDSSPPRTIQEALDNWPKKENYFPSPVDWRDEILYFLLPDRFADENIVNENLLIRRTSSSALQSARENHCNSWKKWCLSGSSRFQGGTIKGIISQLDYLSNLGVSALWIGPVFRQRIETDTYHGYGIQDFFDVDPRFGSRDDLVSLVDKAHDKGMRVILDVIFNHSGTNWVYSGEETGGSIWEAPFKSEGYYETLLPLSGMGHPLEKGSDPQHHDDFVWPLEFREDKNYWKKGSANLEENDYTNPEAEHKVGDFCSLRSFHTINNETLYFLITVYQYWIALTDCDGFRIDTVKHVSAESARNWCNGVTEHADYLGKNRFLLLGEVAGGEDIQEYYSNHSFNLDATLDIGHTRLQLRSLGQGLSAPEHFFTHISNQWNDRMGSHRRYGDNHVSVLDDHDHVMGDKLRFSVWAPCEHQTIVPIAIQFFGLGLPCIYYGTEQALRGLPREKSQRDYITSITNSDGSTKYNIVRSDWLLREAMFGPAHPLASGYDGAVGQHDQSLPGFGVEGTNGKHVFDEKHPLYLRISFLANIRKRYQALNRGRQYLRSVSILGGPFTTSKAGELLAWSRVLDHYELLIIVNTNGSAKRGGRVAIDPALSKSYYVVGDTNCMDDTEIKNGNKLIQVSWEGDTPYIDAGVLEPAEVLVVANYFSK